MERQSFSSLFGSVALLTLALLAMSIRWDLIDYVAPFGDTKKTPLIFLPLLLVSCYATLSWFGLRASLYVIAAAAVGLLLIAMGYIVVWSMVEDPGTRTLISALLIAFGLMIAIARYRDVQANR